MATPHAKVALIHARADRSTAKAVYDALGGAQAAWPRNAAVVLLTRATAGDAEITASLRRARLARVPILGLRIEAVPPAPGWAEAAGPIRWFDAFDGLTPAGLADLTRALGHLRRPDGDAPAAGVLPFAPPRTVAGKPAALHVLQSPAKIRCVAAGAGFALGSSDGTVTTWDEDRGERSYRLAAPVAHLALAAEGNYLAAADANGTFVLLNRRTGEFLRRMPAGQARPQAPFVLSPSGNTLYAAVKGCIETWRFAGPDTERTHDLPGAGARIDRLWGGGYGRHVLMVADPGVETPAGDLQLYSAGETAFSYPTLPGAVLRAQDAHFGRSTAELFPQTPAASFGVLLADGTAGYLRPNGEFRRAACLDGKLEPFDFLPLGDGRWLLLGRDRRCRARLHAAIVTPEGKRRALRMALPGEPKFAHARGNRLWLLLNYAGRAAVYDVELP